jgi:beta-galactosidase
MSRTLFNDGWTVGPKNSVWAQLSPSPDGVTPVTLPHDQLIGQVRTAEGTGRTAYFPNSSEYEYIKRFDAPEEWRGRRVWVEFEAAYRDAMVYVNGARAAHWPNGYSTARVALDDFLRYGEQNTIRVEVRAHDDSRWYTGVGLLRDVHLIVSDLVHVGTEEIFVTTPDVDEHRAVVEAAIPVTNAGLSTTTVIVDTLILDDAGREVAKNSAPITLRGGETATTRQRLYVRNPRRWSTQHPTLYEVRVMVRDATAATTRDEARTTLGIRTLQVDPIFGLRINGEVVNLRGACIHHDNGILGGAGIGRAEERKIELLKEAGFNAIRSSHNPLSATMLDACDRLGMLVMDEAFDAWTENKTAFDYSLAFGDWWERDLEAMIRKDKNHPSVIMYSIGNEIPESGNPIGANWSRRLAEKVRELDDTRYVTNAVNGFVAIISDVATMLKERISAVSPAGEAGASPEGGVNAAGQWMNEIGRSPLVSVRIEEALSTSDIAGLNYSESRYESDRSEYPNRIIVGTETFPKSIASNWKLVENNPHVLGDFTWTGCAPSPTRT